MKKRDSFGVIHQDHCRRPQWTSIRRTKAGKPRQQCKSCGVVFTAGDHSLTPTNPMGY